MKTYNLMGVVAAMFAVMALGSTSAHAQSAWDNLYFEALVNGKLSIGSDSISVDGYRLAAGKSFGDYAFLSVMSDARQVSDAPSDVELAHQSLGVGGHFAFDAGGVQLDPFMQLNLERINFGPAFGIGYGVDVGINIQPRSDLLLTLQIKPYSDVEVANDDAKYTGYALTLAWQLTERVAVAGSYRGYKLEFDDVHFRYKGLLGLGLRFDF